MVVSRACTARKTDGTPCGAAPLVGEDLCLWHHPDHADEVAEARRVGGVNRRRERVVFAAHDYEGLGSIAHIRRLLDLAVMITLQQQHSIAQARTLAYLAQNGIKLLEVGEFEERLSALESVMEPRLKEKRRR